MKKHPIFNIVAYTEKNSAARHQYLVSHAKKPYKAFSTTNGYNNFLKRMNMELVLTDTLRSPSRGEIKLYTAYGEFIEVQYTNTSDIPAEAILFLDFINGSLVDHFYEHLDTGVTIYTPAPHAKEVFKPYSLSVVNEHLEFNG